MDTMQAKAKLSFNLQHRESEAFSVTLTYIVYKTIEKNYNITLNQLKGLFQQHYLMLAKDDVIESTVGSLIAKTLFDSVTRWQRPGNAHAIHLRVKENKDFEKWMQKVLSDHPELDAFEAPIYTRSESNATKQTAKHQ